MVGEVKATVNPYPIFGYRDIMLEIHRPFAWLGHLFSCKIGRTHSSTTFTQGIEVTVGTAIVNITLGFCNIM